MLCYGNNSFNVGISSVKNEKQEQLQGYTIKIKTQCYITGIISEYYIYPDIAIKLSDASDKNKSFFFKSLLMQSMEPKINSYYHQSILDMDIILHDDV